jgi:glycosyltransferase involved in cell wall biosynthesis
MKENITKKKLVVFHPSLAPYRIDLFNELNTVFDANIYLFRKHIISQKFDVHKMEAQLNFKPKFLTIGFELYHKNRIIRFGYLQKIISHKPDIILCSEFNLITFFSAVFVKTIFPKTEIYSLCDDSVDVAKRSSKFRKLGRFLCLKVLNGIVLGNDHAEAWYNKEFPKVHTIVAPIIQKEERILSIINNAQQISGRYLEEYNLKEKNILLFVGRLVEVKNLNFLIEVFSYYVSKNKDAVLILIGDGDKKSELLKLVSDLQMQKNIIFAGRFENEELYAWYRIADYFILPSISETFGAVVNESLIAGVPVICSNLAGASSLINEKNGVTFDPYNKEELLNIFNKILSKKRLTKNSSSINNSLMPFTFNKRMNELISFLNHDNLE